MASFDADEPLNRKRRRGPNACSSCRQRKIRCDGNQPCAQCSSFDTECLYGVEPASKGKSDTILETVLRLEDHLSHISAYLVGLQPHHSPASDAPQHPSVSPQTLGSTEAITSAPAFCHARDLHRSQRQIGDLENASLSAQHASTAESVLLWSCLEAFPALRGNYKSVFALEQHRSRLHSVQTFELPQVGPEFVFETVKSFQRGINFVYPICSASQLVEAAHRVAYQQLDNTLKWCHALLIMALGCSTRVVRHLEPLYDDETRQDTSTLRRLALTYFGLYQQRLVQVQLDLSATSTQCLFYSALFFAYLQRPLQAWSNINASSAQCRALLSYGSAGADMECLRRIFWSCFILESDYLAELADLPHSGVGEMESSVPYPAFHHTHDTEVEREQSSLYFLACLSMRRLLNRVHDLLYARDLGVAPDETRFPQIANEFDRQLEDWRRCLPSEFQFTADSELATSEHSGFLRQRYLTCRALIHRPFLNQVLSKHCRGEHCSEQMLDQANVCLEMCLLHILNLRAFCQTVFVDTWICSLSMSSTMLLLLAASKVPQLKERLRYSRIREAGPHLRELIEPWLQVHGDERSPSVDQSLWMIREVNDLLQREFT